MDSEIYEFNVEDTLDLFHNKKIDSVLDKLIIAARQDNSEKNAVYSIE